ncbi:sulfatase [Ningiella sp. W23]|uniref:sulfatase family protein n=1 Tax=Ningiella sp. W23 TaxID=3023715 RepID=UPI003757EBD2
MRTYSRLLAYLTLVTLLSLSALTRAHNKPEAKPNILWLVVEDMSPILPAYGDHTVKTPAITQLAKEGVRYTNVYSTSGVCAPSRAALALGMYPSAIGANHMRTSSYTEVTGLPKYEAVPPPEAKMLSQLMRKHGYYTTNNFKTDYQFNAPRAAWDESGPYAHWRNRPEGSPFFAVVNFTTTHESGLFEPYGIRMIEFRHYFSDDRARIKVLPQHHAVKTSTADTPVHLNKDTQFDIPPYLPDTELVREDMWKMYNNLVETDKQISAVLEQLKEDGLYEDTIIVFYADHGGPLPRQKRLIYDSGLKVPLIVRFPDGKYAGTSDDQLISFIDFPPSTLALSGHAAPDHMHGYNFLDEFTGKHDGERDFIHAAADRFDGFTDSIRAVKNKRFKYIRNYRPQQAYYLPVEYREKIPTMRELLRLRDEGKLTQAQAQWFRATKPEEELFDTIEDPHELNNLADNPKYAQVLSTLREENIRWLNDIGDQANLEEQVLIDQLWKGEKTKPQTEAPVVAFKAGRLTISSQTNGATISVKRVSKTEESVSWRLYQAPFEAQAGQTFQIVAHRLGYDESPVLTYTVN